MRHTVAALYVDPRGPYPKMPHVDCWDEARDARRYAGPLPVVAHPPCARWCRFAVGLEKRYGYKVGDDNGCFAAALDAVRKYGGVLEHPAHSKAWPAYALPAPNRNGGWTYDEPAGLWVCEVWQSAYGHLARKRTWLVYVGTCEPVQLDWAHAPHTHRIGHDSKNARPRFPRLPDNQTHLTPPKFAQALAELAGQAFGATKTCTLPSKTIILETKSLQISKNEGISSR